MSKKQDPPEITILERKKIHLTEIDEVLGEYFINRQKPFELLVEDYSDDGFITTALKESDRSFSGATIDFDLSDSECAGLYDRDIDSYIGKEIYTGSAYEFLEYLCHCTSNINLLVSLREGSWVFQILDTKR